MDFEWRKDTPIIEWKTWEKKEKTLPSMPQFILVCDGVDLIRAEEHSTHDGYIRPSRVSQPSEDDFALIPRLFYGYSVWEREFFLLDIRCVHQRKITKEAGLAFNQLTTG